MKIVQQRERLTVRDLEKELLMDSGAKVDGAKHSSLFPSSIRCLIVGPSGSGKSNAMLSMLVEPKGLKFANIYIYSRSLHQPKYTFLKEALKRVKGMGYFTFSENESVMMPDEARPNSIFVFDDVSMDNQNPMRHFFSMGRHHGIDSFYLCQSYTKIPKHLLRDNANMLLIFKQDDLNMRHVYEDHVSIDMSFNKFRDMCTRCWKDSRYGFLMINKDCDVNNGRYRINFDGFIRP